MNARLARVTGTAGLLYVAVLAANLVGTTDGPRPNVAAAKEATRIAAESTAVRWSALLGLLGALAFCAFTTGLASLLARAGERVGGAALGAAGVVTAAVWVVSFAALAAAAQTAQQGARPDLTMAMGSLHSISLIMSFAPAGVVLLTAVAAGAVRTKAARAATTLIGCAGIASAALVLDVHLDTGRFGALIVLPFLGIPIWIAIMSVRLAGNGALLPTSAHAPAITPYDHPSNALAGQLPRE